MYENSNPLYKDNFDLFVQHVFECAPGNYYKIGVGVDQERILRTAWKIYQKVVLGTIIDKLTIVGRLALKIDGQWVPSNEEFPTIDKILKENLKVVSGDPLDPDIGSILETDYWSLLANDAWLLGSIHAPTEFHFATPLDLYRLWDYSQGRMRVTGRELIGIFCLGYKIYRTQLEPIARCENEELARSSTFMDYKRHVQEWQDEKEDFEAFLKKVKNSMGEPQESRPLVRFLHIRQFGWPPRRPVTRSRTPAKSVGEAEQG